MKKIYLYCWDECALELCYNPTGERWLLTSVQYYVVPAGTITNVFENSCELMYVLAASHTPSLKMALKYYREIMEKVP